MTLKRFIEWDKRNEKRGDQMRSAFTTLMGMILAIFLIVTVTISDIEILDLPTNVLILVMSGLIISVILLVSGRIERQLIKIRNYEVPNND